MADRNDLLAGLPSRAILLAFVGTLGPLVAVIVALAFYGSEVVAKGLISAPTLYVFMDYVYVIVIATGVYVLGVRGVGASLTTIGFRRCGIDWIVKAFLLAVLLHWLHLLVDLSWAAAGFARLASLPLANDVDAVRAGSMAVAIALSLVVAFLTPIAVEVFSRGILFAWMRRNLDFWLSAIASSIVFGVIHIEIVKYGQAVVFGIVAAYLYERSRSLWPPIVLHVAMNAGYMIEVLRIVLVN